MDEIRGICNRLDARGDRNGFRLSFSCTVTTSVTIVIVTSK